MGMSKKTIGIGATVGVLLAGAAGSYYINSAAEKEMAKEISKSATFSKIDCDMFLGNTCTVTDFKDNMQMFKVKEITIKGIRDLAALEDVSKLNGSYSVETHFKGVSAQDGSSLLATSISNSDRKKLVDIMGEEAVNTLATKPFDFDFYNNIDASNEKWKIATNFNISVDKFPSAVGAGITFTAPTASVETIKSSAVEMNPFQAMSTLETLVLNDAHLKLKQEDSFFSSRIHNFYVKSAKENGVNTPKTWKAWNSGIFNEKEFGIKSSLASKDSAADKDELVDFIAKLSSDNKSKIKTELLEATGLKENDIKKIVDELIDSDSGEITLKVANNKNMSIQEMMNMKTYGGLDMDKFAKSFKIEVL